MAIVKQYHKDTDTTYVYESESYWDPEKKQSRSRRKVIGKIDPDTGKIIPTGQRGRKKKEPDGATTPSSGDDLAEISSLYAAGQEKIRTQAERIRSLEQELKEMQRRNEKLIAQMKRADSALQQIRQYLTTDRNNG